MCSANFEFALALDETSMLAPFVSRPTAETGLRRAFLVVAPITAVQWRDEPTPSWDWLGHLHHPHSGPLGGAEKVLKSRIV